MATVTKEILSSTTAGEAAYVGATRATIHTAGSSSKDEIWLYATNNGAVRETLTISFGGTGVDASWTLSIDPAGGLTLVVPGLILENSYIMYGTASTASTISVVGYVNRIT